MTTCRFPVLLCWLLLPPIAAAQETAPSTIAVELGVEPATVTVGEPFVAAVRVTPPPGVRVDFEEFTGDGHLEPLAPVQVTGDGTAFYRLVAWRADVPLTGMLPVRLVEASGEARIQLVRLGLPAVRSVLPAGDTSIVPRPAKGYLPIPGTEVTLPWWYWLVALLGAGVAATLGLHYLRRAEPPVQSDLGARDWALRQVDALVEKHERLPVVEVYLEGGRILQGYLERVDPELGTDLTTAELLGRLSRDPAAGGAADLGTALEEADRVKFSGSAAGADPLSWLAAVRRWIEVFPVPDPVESHRSAA